MIPRFTSIWDRVGDRWFLSKTAAVLFTCAAILVLFMTVALTLDVINDRGGLSKVVWGLAGVMTALSIFFVWSGMWRFWDNVDGSSRFARSCWFFTMLLGFWYGAILYLFCVYLPSVSKGSFGREVTS